MQKRLLPHKRINVSSQLNASFRVGMGKQGEAREKRTWPSAEETTTIFFSSDFRASVGRGRNTGASCTPCATLARLFPAKILPLLLMLLIVESEDFISEKTERERKRAGLEKKTLSLPVEGKRRISKKKSECYT